MDLARIFGFKNEAEKGLFLKHIEGNILLL